MSEPSRGNPIQIAAVVLLLAGGGWYFFRNYQVEGLDGVSVTSKTASLDSSNASDFGDDFADFDTGSSFRFSTLASTSGANGLNPFDAARASERDFSLPSDSKTRVEPSREASSKRYKNLRIASWALDGFGPTKLENPLSRKYVVRIIHQFDIVALQQISASERDLVPRLIDEINQSGRKYDYLIGQSSGPAGRQEQLAFVFDTTRVRVDRTQTYTVADPENQMSFDPLVAWFQSSEPPVGLAWTFTLVNVRIDLGRAAAEVALLPKIAKSVRTDGRGEDDVVLAGLFQADDEYLVPILDGKHVRAAVRSTPTDIFGRYQTSNLLMETTSCSEYLGRGGAFDFLRVYNLSLAEAEVVTSHLPVFAEFTATEGGQL